MWFPQPLPDLGKGLGVIKKMSNFFINIHVKPTYSHFSLIPPADMNKNHS